MPFYPIDRAAPAPQPANAVHAIPAPGLLTDAAARAQTNAALDALAAAINELRAKLIESGDLR